jgi:hypothetical protein
MTAFNSPLTATFNATFNVASNAASKALIATRRLFIFRQQCFEGFVKAVNQSRLSSDVVVYGFCFDAV